MSSQYDGLTAGRWQLSADKPIHVISGKQELVDSVSDHLGPLQVLGKILKRAAIRHNPEHSDAEAPWEGDDEVPF